MVTKAVQAAVVEHKEDYLEFKKKFQEHSQVLDLKLTLLMRLITQMHSEGEPLPNNGLALLAREVSPGMSPEEMLAKINSVDGKEETRDCSVTSRCLPLPIKPCAPEDEAPPAWNDGPWSASDAGAVTAVIVEDLERDE